MGTGQLIINNLEDTINDIETMAPYLTGESRNDWPFFTDTFGQNMQEYTEISLTPSGDGIGVMTRGRDADFEEKIARYLTASGIEREDLGLFNNLKKSFSGTTTLIKADFDTDNRFKFALYWQYLVPFAFFEQLGRKHGVEKECLDFLRDVSLLVQCPRVFVGIGYMKPDQKFFKIYFSHHVRECREYISPGVSAVLARLGLSAENINFFIGIHDFLFPEARGNIYLSFTFRDKLPASAKLDYGIIPLVPTLEVMRALNYEPEDGIRLKNNMDILEMERLTYLALKLGHNNQRELKFYLDRKFSRKNSENPNVLVDFLKTSRWV